MRSRSRASRSVCRALITARLPVAATLLACLLGIVVAGPAHAASIAAGNQHAHKQLARLQVSPAVPGPGDTHRAPTVPDVVSGTSRATPPPVAGAARTVDDSSSLTIATTHTRGRGPPSDV